MRISKIGLIVLLVVAPHALFAQFVSFWTLSEHQPNIKEGGRANTIAVHPGDDNHMFVASETGGLFETTDGGLRWTHVDSLPLFLTQSVVYLPSNPNILLVSAKADFKTTNGGGIWRSSNGGMTWEQRPLNIAGFNGRLSAHEISIMPGSGTIVVGTSEGVFFSTDTGLTWTYSNVFGSGNKTVFAVLATPGRIYAGGPSGTRVATGPLFSNWTPPVLDPAAFGGIQDIHAFGRSPVSDAHAFVVNGATNLFVTEDGGNIWRLLPSAPPGGGSCGGISFIKAVERLSDLAVLYFSNRCWMHRLVVPFDDDTDVADYSGTWSAAAIDHADTRDVAFNEFRVPMLLATDGGVHKTTDGGNTWQLAGGGKTGGYNALQITEVRGQYVEERGVTDLYFGTQDNNLWATNVWANDPKSFPNEGFFIELHRRVKIGQPVRINYVACGPCRNWQSGRRFVDERIWNHPPGEAGKVVLLGDDHYIQGVKRTKAFFAGLALTEDNDQNWRQFAQFLEEPRDIPKLGRFGGNDPFTQTSIVYQAYKSNLPGPGLSKANRLMRIHKRILVPQEGLVFYPSMTNFGGLGINPTMFAKYQVIGIDPGNAYHLIAPDVVNQKMMRSTNGGETWAEIPGLTGLVTNGGTLLFRTNIEKSDPVHPIVTAVSFSPQNPRFVLIGTSEGGIYLSEDNGGTWKKINGTEKATYITSFFWETLNRVYVSTYGRGLWKLRNTPIAIPTAFEELCGDSCDVVTMDGKPEPPPFDGSVMVFEGRMLGMKTDDGRLREVLVTPASSVIFTGDPKDPQDDIVITEGTEKEAGDYEPLPAPPDGWIVKGLVFTDGDTLTGAVFGDAERTLLPPVSEENYEGPTESPVKGTPYIRLMSADMRGVATAVPNAEIELTATDLVAAASYEVLIDGVPMKETYTADGTGSFQTTIIAPAVFGYHRVDVRMVGDEKVLDSSEFLVIHED